ncbi:unnamed protein product [Darwinula stevensoni]|uniref:DNA replication complex GINS protein PSF1 n=1 Tax=Darwinula stevensoni TaxID=69355 RepID=A0A7R8XDK0_9CRUS|nr:unnamed protein product [Darwinula stevensoni]CAG0886911.1 unnamed protein product [Darwinula stevensoni]
MFASRAVELIKDLQRSDTMPPFNEDGIRQVLDEMKALYEENHRDVNATVAGSADHFNAVHLRHSALERSKRCLLAYLFTRLKCLRDMRWDFGSILPSEIRFYLCEPEVICMLISVKLEVQWFQAYSKSLGMYMHSIGRQGLDLTQNLQPPKSLYIEVRCLEDYGEIETDDGDFLVLRKNSTHFLPRGQAEPLIRQGILEHIS